MPRVDLSIARARLEGQELVGFSAVAPDGTGAKSASAKVGTKTAPSAKATAAKISKPPTD